MKGLGLFIAIELGELHQRGALGGFDSEKHAREDSGRFREIYRPLIDLGTTNGI